MRRWLPDIGGRKQARRRLAAPAHDPRSLRTAWQLISLLLEYPTAELKGRVPRFRAASSELPPEVAAPLDRLLDFVDGTPLGQLERAYVETFDHTRKCALHLTYYAHGETRKRGIALVQFKQAFRRGGLEVVDDELPDHLCVVLEFGATGDLEVAWDLVNRHRAGIELLQMALAQRSSPWLDAVDALRTTLPVLDGEQRDAVAKLLHEGPPNEDVGLDTYALDPRLNPHPDADAELLGAQS